MRVLVCGGRNFTDRRLLCEALDNLLRQYRVATIIHGDARGADRMAGEWAKRHHIAVVAFPADWARDQFAAGPIRNRRMLVDGRPDLVVAFPGGRGTADMVRQARRAGVPVQEITGSARS